MGKAVLGIRDASRMLLASLGGSETDDQWGYRGVEWALVQPGRILTVSGITPPADGSATTLWLTSYHPDGRLVAQTQVQLPEVAWRGNLRSKPFLDVRVLGERVVITVADIGSTSPTRISAPLQLHAEIDFEAPYPLP